MSDGVAGTSPAPFLTLEGIRKRYGGVHALRGIDLVLGQGEVHCLAGENGSGKSTLIKIIAGVEAPDPGGVIGIDGRRVAALTPPEALRCGIQVIYQDLSLFPNMTVAENIAIEHQRGLGFLRRAAMERIARAAMARIGIALDPAGFVADLPIASRQLVAICRAIANDARLVIMDEPTASLTRREVDALLSLVLELRRSGVAVVFVSHRLDEVLEIADRVTVLRNGAMEGSFPASGMTGARLGELMTGRSFEHRVLGTDRRAAPVVIETERLGRTGDYADISLSVRRGEILGITGRLGSGRTELALSLFGMRRPERGRILLGGEEVVFRSNRDAVAHGIAYLSEDRLSLGLVMEQPISSNVVIGVLARMVGRTGLVDAAARRALVRRQIEALAIKASDPELPVATLSGGNQQRVALGKWLATKPRVLILDSPTVGVDIGAKDGIYRIVRELADAGLAVILISDEIPEVLYNSHRVLVMREGRIAAELDPAASDEAMLQELVDA